MGKDLADRAAVREDRHALVGVGLSDPQHSSAHSLCEGRARLRSGDHVPALLLHHPHRDRVTFGDVLAELPAFPVAKEHLAKIGLHPWAEVEHARQR